MRDLKFSVTGEVINLGVRILTVYGTGLQNTKYSPRLEPYIAGELESIQKFWSDKNYKDDKILLGFRELHSRVGKSNRNYLASPEELLRIFLSTGRFPRINCIVDIYNLISLKTRLALGAHDVVKITGNITLKLTGGDEKFHPLGKKEEVKISSGEYGYIDDGNNVICRMEVLQVEPTKITLNSKDIFFIIQGNANTSEEYLKNSADELIKTLKNYCGGNYKFLN